MLSSVATPVQPLAPSKPHAPSQHQYGTRIRSNSVIKPSIRLRQVSEMPRRIKPVPPPKQTSPATSEPPDMPVFPPPQVMLHSEDANSKVFHAIGRSFMSVDNKAMTIKDLAELTMKFGLMCQNVSAAGQAITTYIRNHIQRCEEQQDQPLLLRHVLSGTPSDDDLVPALYSRTGGAHCMLNPTGGRVTNFRRGTMVWYLSKAAGVPCPFARAGIRLSDYGENGKRGTSVNPAKERKRTRDRLRRAEQCGQKRKRPVRSCAARTSDTDSSSEEERPAPKVKLTLRLNPSLVSKRSASPPASCPPSDVIDLSRNSSDSEDSDEDSMSVDSSDSEDDSEESCEDTWCLPPYPQEATQEPNGATHASTTTPHDRYWRSPSVPSSTVSASPPPDSPDEDDGMDEVYPSLSTRYSSESSWQYEDDEDFFADMEDADTQWGESPGPVSPPAQFDDEDITVKEEPRDVGGLLESWDGGFSALKVIDSDEQRSSFATDLLHPKLEDIDTWGWDSSLVVGASDPLASSLEYIKKEDDEPQLLFSEHSSSSPTVTSASPLSLDTPGASHDVKPYDLDIGVWDSGRGQMQLRIASLAVEVEASCISNGTHELNPSTRVESTLASPDVAQSLATFPPLPFPSLVSTGQPLRLPTTDAQTAYLTPRPRSVLYQTVQPCAPAICATDLEGVFVYQMVLGSSLILRRVDTNFVNISPILQFFGMEQPDLTTLSSPTVVTRGSSLVCGTWTPLSTAQDMFRSHAFLDNFLSNNLHECFLGSFLEVRNRVLLERFVDEFGPPFQSTIDAKRGSFHLELPQQTARASWELDMVNDPLLSVHPSFAFGSTSFRVGSSSPDHIVAETPLSPTEEAMFRVLCTAADWETTPSTDDLPQNPLPVELEPETMETEPPAVEIMPPAERAKEREKPLRRSKRVNMPPPTTRPCTRSAAKRVTRPARS
ncbi:hypothetical protein BDY19DRAFT_353379 [Irpex rosettiformis]|uniref:Uncharacterized protein n=1 Tax=Irpex rosettiformis TaxID=378272 RepID=A0ACB8TWH2_9APHY|nr:hypothetical protein BDY19DRAFT_353379 [Irpex rosettiformis]